MEPWLQYQSVLQLAAGTNIAITGLLSVYGSEFGREERRIKALEDSVSSFRSKLANGDEIDNELDNKLAALIRRSSKLKNKSSNQQNKSQALIIGGTIICLVAGVLSLSILVISSFKPEVTSEYSYIFASLLAAPPFVIVIIAACRYLFVTRLIHLDRERIETDLLIAAGSWLATKTAGGANGSRKSEVHSEANPPAPPAKQD